MHAIFVFRCFDMFSEISEFKCKSKTDVLRLPLFKRFQNQIQMKNPRSCERIYVCFLSLKMI